MPDAVTKIEPDAGAFDISIEETRGLLYEKAREKVDCCD
jgi:hypothetical protein